MILSTQTDCLGSTVNDFEAVKMIAAAGFDAVDFSMFGMTDENNILNTSEYKTYIKELKTTGEGSGVFFNQSHAPFPSCRYGNDSYNSRLFKTIVRSLEISGMLGIRVSVVHPTQTPKGIDQKEYNTEFYNRLIPYAKEYGVIIAIENMFTDSWLLRRKLPNVCSLGPEFAEYIDALDSEYITACLDIGHCGLVGGNPAQMVRELGTARLTALHVHDNDYVNDLHTMPFTQKIDWDEVTEALREINYSGDFTYECDYFLHKLPAELRADGLKLMERVGRYLISRIVG